ALIGQVFRMRLTTIQAHQPSQPNTPHFVSARGETLMDYVPKHDLISGSITPDWRTRVKPTLMITEQDGTMPRTGRLRDDLSPFPMQGYTLTTQDQEVSIQTDSLKIVVNQEDASLTWYDQYGERFAADLQHRAYTYDRTGRTLFH